MSVKEVTAAGNGIRPLITLSDIQLFQYIGLVFSLYFSFDTFSSYDTLSV